MLLVSARLTGELLHILNVFTLVIDGLGFTVTVAVVEDEQVFAVAVTVNVVTCCAFVLLTSVPLIGVPDPLAAMPVRLIVLIPYPAKSGACHTVWVRDNHR